MNAQAFLLDVLESKGEHTQLGNNTVRPPPRFRLVAATKVPLAESHLREDLRFRLLGGHVVEIPTLEERKEDIPGFLVRFAREAATNLSGSGVLMFEPDALTFAQEQTWPGQIRQLRAVAAHAATVAFLRSREPTFVVVAREDLEVHLNAYGRALGASGSEQRLIRHQTAPDGPPPALPTRGPVNLDDPAGPDHTLPRAKKPRDLTEQDVRSALATTGGNKARAAKQLDVAVNTLKNKIRRFRIG